MSHRAIVRNSLEARKCQYEKLERTGEQQQAIMDAFEALSEQGFNVGNNMETLLTKRRTIKGRNPK
jgi:hypothetical protein